MLNGETYVYYIYKTPAAAVTLAKRKKKRRKFTSVIHNIHDIVPPPFFSLYHAGPNKDPLHMFMMLFGQMWLHRDRESIHGDRESTWGQGEYMGTGRVHGDRKSTWRQKVHGNRKSTWKYGDYMGIERVHGDI